MELESLLHAHPDTLSGEMRRQETQVVEGRSNGRDEQWVVGLDDLERRRLDLSERIDDESHDDDAIRRVAAQRVRVRRTHLTGEQVRSLIRHVAVDGVTQAGPERQRCRDNAAAHAADFDLDTDSAIIYAASAERLAEYLAKA